MVSATTLGALCSSAIAGYLADRFGRKPIIIVAALLFILGSLEQAASQVLKELVLGRVIVGLAVGLASMVLPAYVAEVAPAAVRGKLITSLIVLVTGGQVLAYLLGFAFFNVSHVSLNQTSTRLASDLTCISGLEVDASCKWRPRGPSASPGIQLA